MTNTTLESQQQKMGPFFTIWIGQASSLLGSQLVQFALVWWLTKITHSATMLALATLMALLPQILIGPFAGVLVDRWSRRSVMIVADSMIAVATLVLALFFWLNIIEVWHIYVLLLIRATGAAFHWPAMQASTTLMVPKTQLARIAGLNQTLYGVVGIFIPPLGALAIEVLPMQGVLAIDVLTAIPAVVSLFLIAIPEPVRKNGHDNSTHNTSMWTDMREGLQFMLNWKALMMFSVIGIVINIFGRAAAALTPLLVTQHFQGGAMELGWLEASVGFGAVVGGIILGVWGGFKRRIATMLLALVLDGIAIIVIGLSPMEAFWTAVFVIFFVGFLETISIGLNGAIFQSIIPAELQGRVFSLLISVGQILSPLGLLLAGPIADTFGVRFWWVVTGVAIGGTGLGALFVPAIVKIENINYSISFEVDSKPASTLGTRASNK